MYYQKRYSYNKITIKKIVVIPKIYVILQRV